MLKSIYCIRNADNISSQITKKGLRQINRVKNSWKDRKYIELVITDTDIQSIDTANGIFNNKHIIPLKFPDCPICDHQFYGKCQRLDLFYEFLKTRNESSIAYVGHGTFINKIQCYNISKVNYLKRAKPYLVELTLSDLCDN